MIKSCYGIVRFAPKIRATRQPAFHAPRFADEGIEETIHLVRIRLEPSAKLRPNRFAAVHSLAMCLVLPVPVAIAVTLNEIFRVVSYGGVELGVEDPNALDQHEIDRMRFVLQERKGERECVHVELYVSRRVKLRLEPIDEMAHERVNMLLR